MSGKVTSQEIFSLIDSVAEGRSSVVAVHHSWGAMGAGDVLFRVVSGEFQGWEVEWFNDSMSWDYLNHVWAPDGREICFEDFSASEDILADDDTWALHNLSEPPRSDIWENAPSLGEPWRPEQ